jgi:hypothetical protein
MWSKEPTQDEEEQYSSNDGPHDESVEHGHCVHPVHCIKILARSLVTRARENSSRISPIVDFIFGAGVVLNVLARN